MMKLSKSIAVSCLLLILAYTPALSSNVIAACVDIAGPWSCSENAIITCSAAGESETQHVSGSGDTTFVQNGCSVFYTVPRTTYTRSGTIQGNSVTLSGILAVFASGVIVRENNLTVWGTISPDTRTMSMDGSGFASGTFEGIEGSCTATSQVSCTRYISNFLLMVSKAGTGTGTVIASPYGINCGGVCSASYAQGTTVTLTATADSGSDFTGWSGACSGTGTCVVTVNWDTQVTANFIPQVGTPKWSYTTEGQIYSSPAVGSDGTIYVGSGWGDNKLHAINSDGTLKWSYTTEHAVQSSPAVGSDGTIYVGSFDNKLYAINSGGTLKWSYTTGNGIYSSPAIGSDGTIYVGSYDGKLYAVNSNGTLKWSYTTGGQIFSSPAIGSDGTIYIGLADGQLHAVAFDGAFKWSSSTGNAIYSSPAIGSDGTIYIGSNDRKLYATDSEGSLKWSYTTGDSIWSSPAIGVDGTIYVGSFDGKLYAINSNGTLRWSYATGGQIYSSPAIGSDGTIYVGSYDGKLYAVNSNGTLKRTYGTALSGLSYSSPAIGSDGTIYVGSSYNSIYAFDSMSSGLADSPWPMFHHGLKHTGRVRSISDYFDTVQKLYIGYYQRPADAAGLLFWANAIAQIDTTHTGTFPRNAILSILHDFAFSVEAQSLYHGNITGSNIATVVNSIYRGLFNRDPDPGGLAFYVGGFNAGGETPATILWSIMNGAQNSDLQSINNKLAAALSFTRAIDPNFDGANFQVTYAGDADATGARTWLSSVTWETVTIPTKDQTTTWMRSNIANPGDPILNQ
jgi:outer membrane protein assembly factor BamB